MPIQMPHRPQVRYHHPGQQEAEAETAGDAVDLEAELVEIKEVLRADHETLIRMTEVLTERMDHLEEVVRELHTRTIRAAIRAAAIIAVVGAGVTTGLMFLGLGG